MRAAPPGCRPSPAPPRASAHRAPRQSHHSRAGRSCGPRRRTRRPPRSPAILSPRSLMPRSWTGLVQDLLGLVVHLLQAVGRIHLVQPDRVSVLAERVVKLLRAGVPRLRLLERLPILLQRRLELLEADHLLLEPWIALD